MLKSLLICSTENIFNFWNNRLGHFSVAWKRTDQKMMHQYGLCTRSTDITILLFEVHYRFQQELFLKKSNQYYPMKTTAMDVIPSTIARKQVGSIWRLNCTTGIFQKTTLMNFSWCQQVPSGLSNMLRSNNQGDDVINPHLFSRNISGVIFNFIPHVGLDIPRGWYTK